MRESIEENRKEEIPVDNREANLLRADSLLEEGEWRKALHIYLEEEARDKIIETALDFRNQDKEEEYQVALKYLELLERKKLDK